MTLKFLVIGSGFSGSVLAHELVNSLDCTIDIWEERSHIAGNCFTSEDSSTGIMVHRYGPHIFNTDKKEIWDYVNRFTEIRPYVHRAKAFHNGKIYSFPLNLATLNQFFHRTFTPDSAKEYLSSIADHSITNPGNFEEQAKSFIGEDLYKAFFYGYTKKQWGCEPRELPASIIKRIPVRFNYDDNYHRNLYTGIPLRGYTHFVEQLLNNPQIRVTLNREFRPGFDDVSAYDHIFYTGPLDAWFHHEFGRLGYRTVYFESSVFNGDYQGIAQINYCDTTTTYTRITEHKYFTPWKSFDQSIIFHEYSKETGKNDIPYYPKRLAPDKEMLRKYRNKAMALKGVSFLGRLATYRYLDMQHVIKEAIDFSKKFSDSFRQKLPTPVFPNEETF